MVNNQLINPKILIPASTQTGVGLASVPMEISFSKKSFVE
jgi:hypothetical protein